jgi:hypothetical protein
MSVKDVILTTRPTSYWPLDDLSGFFVLSRRDGRASGDLEPLALGRRNRLDLERRCERPTHLRDAPRLRLSG